MEPRILVVLWAVAGLEIGLRDGQRPLGVDGVGGGRLRAWRSHSGSFGEQKAMK